MQQLSEGYCGILNREVLCEAGHSLRPPFHHNSASLALTQSKVWGL